VHRDRLTEGWPPDRSEAATAFVGRVNDMIDVMTQTAGAANRICIGIDEAFAAVRDARRQLESMMTKYSREPGQGLVAANARSAELDRQGRDVLIASDARIVTAAGKINSGLPRYRRFDEPGSTILSDQSPGDGGGSGLPGGSGSGVGLSSSMLSAPVFDPPPPSSVDGVRHEDLGVGSGDGLTLVRDPSVQAGAPVGGASKRVPLGPTGVIGGVPALGKPSSMAPGIVGPEGVISAPRQGNTAVNQSAAPPIAGAVARTDSARGIRRRPPAGSIGPSEPLGSRGATGMAGGYRDRSYEVYTERRRSKRTTSDGNELWAVREGVPPVLEAPAEPSHDPGPGVLGIDR
jgi:hypothetical protein